ncbi:MAG: hypothetical protein GWN99_20500 [Gemmatimonadetes bacterium]|uniref:Uncharacterized protein n=1 Tax=Candidatus Kutchimonas denitrificans TaxID=3056748 RepID=A0AAE5CD54_9BACT|nr:hypothetical protein [Gemmatimonadota bacterium]NIR76635.1 hypothetical protein [Candidatus Kutchimonas denitrificans]NIS03404.1 hypothetical protein [Gemmatimonadota bacterium]NIT69265.1 hypothetical protein [Gemmatimonadota bacterium]NIU54737.1 hypothetical protein [Gemmatimonadota bacterium]
MYQTCIYCNRKLGSNEIVENFPVGRRLAFDAEKGRLWAVCEGCRRWNLSPLEERWEAIDECERQYRDGKRRISTDNIGLTRLREGLELVRIGRPLRPEFAAWRYGKQFIRRRLSRVIRAAGQTIGYLLIGVTGIPIIMFFLTDENSKVIARVKDERGRRLVIARRDLKELELVQGVGEGDWALRVPYRPGERFGRFGRVRARGQRVIALLEGSLAIRALGHILPRINSFGGTTAEVKNAVQLIEQTGSSEGLLAAAPALVPQTRFTLMDKDTRLALEMAAHEESERRAMEGELAALEAAWREAEEIAAIADRLLAPASVDSWIERHKNELER